MYLNTQGLLEIGCTNQMGGSKIMRRVYKYVINPLVDGVVNLPEDAEVLHTAFQGDALCLWAMVDTEAKPIARKFRVFGTGHDIPLDEDIVYIGTAFTGYFVFHIFEQKLPRIPCVQDPYSKS